MTRESALVSFKQDICGDCARNMNGNKCENERYIWVEKKDSTLKMGCDNRVPMRGIK